jgi:hypothetical protein
MFSPTLKMLKPWRRGAGKRVVPWQQRGAYSATTQHGVWHLQDTYSSHRPSGAEFWQIKIRDGEASEITAKNGRGGKALPSQGDEITKSATGSGPKDLQSAVVVSDSDCARRGRDRALLADYQAKGCSDVTPLVVWPFLSNLCFVKTRSRSRRVLNRWNRDPGPATPRQRGTTLLSGEQVPWPQRARSARGRQIFGPRKAVPSSCWGPTAWCGVLGQRAFSLGALRTFGRSPFPYFRRRAKNRHPSALRTHI